jgi:histidine ammonia-lyase
MAVEIGAVSDNPVVLPDTGEVLSGGNFHGQPLAVPLDALALALVSLAGVSERRLFRLLDHRTNNGLPAFLVAESGRNSGLMLLQYTAASLVSESKAMAHPASVDSIPSSAGQEDHVSMGMTSARHAREIVASGEVVVALEVLAAAQGLDLRAPLAPGAGSAAARDAVREVVPHLDADREMGSDIEAIVGLVSSGRLVSVVERAVGRLD